MSNSLKSSNSLLSFNYGDERILFEHKLRPRNMDKILIKVHPNGRVVVSAPKGVTSDILLPVVKQRGRWIYQQLLKFQQQLQHITPRQYISGESHLYLGKRYLLKVNLAPNQPQSVKLLRGNLEVSVRKHDPARVKKLLTEWYKERAYNQFAQRMGVMLERTLWVKTSPPITVRRMKTQWGSCSSKKRITLNLNLIKAPRDCIDYVILHELCHLKEHNHGEAFYRLLSQVMPEWKSVKQRLDDMAAKLLIA